jgi:hypothetical protein
MQKISRNGFINSSKERNVALEYVDKLKIATSSTEKEAASYLAAINKSCFIKVPLCRCRFADAG